MSNVIKCSDCGYQIDFKKDKVLQTAERGLEGFYHSECYHIKKGDKK